MLRYELTFYMGAGFVQRYDVGEYKRNAYGEFEFTLEGGNLVRVKPETYSIKSYHEKESEAYL